MKKNNRLIFFIGFFSALFFNKAVYAKGQIEEDLAGEYFSIAEGYGELKNYQKAVDYYKKAEKSAQYKNAVQYNLAQVYALQSDWENCLKYLTPLYTQVPDNIKIASAYAYALSSSGKEKKAIEIYKKIYTDNPETPVYFFNYVRILITAKKYTEASALLEESKEIFNSDTDKKTLNDLIEKIRDILNPPKKKKNKEKESSNLKPTEKEMPAKSPPQEP